MWVFGYGSLMWDGWECSRGCSFRTVASLPGFRRTFNKASVVKWGTKQHPGPTLNLECDPAAASTGMAFEFPDMKPDELLCYLKQREACDSVVHKIVLADGRKVVAFVSLYTGKNLMRGKTLSERVEMARKASGTSGSCFDYVRSVAEKLAELGLDDRAVTEFWEAVQEIMRSGNNALVE